MDEIQQAVTALASRGVAFRYDTAGTPAALEKAIHEIAGTDAYIIAGRTPAAQAAALRNAPQNAVIFVRDFLPTLDVRLLHSYKNTPPAGAVVVPEVLTPKQVAEMLGCSTNTLRNQRSRHKAGEPVETPPWHTYNKKILYYASDLKQWLEERPIYGL